MSSVLFLLSFVSKAGKSPSSPKSGVGCCILFLFCPEIKMCKLNKIKSNLTFGAVLKLLGAGRKREAMEIRK